MTLQGNIVDLIHRKIFFGEIVVQEGRIKKVDRLHGRGVRYILPGFVDAHVHIESSMLVPSEFARLAVCHGTVATVSDLQNDFLKFAVVNRYQDEKPALAFIHNFGLQKGAIASCVGHDSHNITVVGVDDVSMAQAVNLIVRNKGGIAAVADTAEKVLPLPIAGIMAQEDGYTVGEKYSEIDRWVKEELGCKLSAPYMTLSFMALLVIPELKLSDKGLFDGRAFKFVSLFEQ